MTSAEIFEIISLFPNFSKMEEDSEGLFFEAKDEDNKKVFEQMMV